MARTESHEISFYMATENVMISIFDYAHIKAIIGMVVVLSTNLIGDNYTIQQALLILVVMDATTGMTRAIKNKEKITSSKLKKSVLKLFLYLCLLISAHQVSRIDPVLLWVDTFAATFIAVTELISVLENLSQSGLIIPGWVRERLSDYLETGK